MIRLGLISSLFALGLLNPAQAQDGGSTPVPDTGAVDIVFGNPIQFTGIGPDRQDVVFGNALQFTGLIENDISPLEDLLDELLAIDAMFDEWITPTDMARSLSGRSLNSGRFTEETFLSWLSDELRWLFLDYQQLELWLRNDRNIAAFEQGINALRFEQDEATYQSGVRYFQDRMPEWRERYGSIAERYLICVLLHMDAAQLEHAESRRLWSAADYDAGAYNAAFARYEAARAEAANCVDPAVLDEMTRGPVFEWPLPE